jgi:tripeptide aminopeptidase
MSVVLEKFLKYVSFDTQSKDNDECSCPSTTGQWLFAEELVNELQEIGAKEITFDRNHCYIYATIPATVANVPTLGFIAHMDTSPAASGQGVSPRIVSSYDGGKIILNKEQNVVLDPNDFPELKNYIGKSLVVTDGTTLLGADDKAGIAEIMTMAEYLLQNPQIPHGKIRIGFTPDEEIGCGADYFDVEAFGADYAYTVDGGALGELEYENFNAAGAKLIVHGRSVHPGDAKNKMLNAILLAQEFQDLLPVEQNPMYTEMYEGFYHADSISGNVEQVIVDYIIRDHDREKFEEKKSLFLQAFSPFFSKYCLHKNHIANGAANDTDQSISLPDMENHHKRTSYQFRNTMRRIDQ